MRGVKLDLYLKSTPIIDWENSSVREKAKQLSQGVSGDVEIAKACYEFVRDQIRHSNDFKLNPVTITASEVLAHKTGFCYAKSHLLAALLRANAIPAGICYQRLTIDHDEPPFCLHGLNAVYLENYGWYRMDARGNKEGVGAGFTPPIEKLAFEILVDGEADFAEIWPEPLPVVIDVLKASNTYQDVYDHLPDIAITGGG